MAVAPSKKNISLAVLPFDDHKGKSAYDYFSSGLVEELIVDLCHFPELQVLSSYSAKRLTSENTDELETARDLDINYILKGSIWQRDQTLRLNIQLLDTTNGKVVWADRFDAPENKLFAIQDTIVERVAASISTEVQFNLLQAARKKPVTSLAAYDCWLRGMNKLRLGTLDADREARQFFTQALALDPNCSKAYAGLSLSHFNEWSCQLWELYAQSEADAYKYAVKAYQLDDTDHLTQMILGRIYIYRRQFDQAEHHIEKSLELNRNDADNLVQLASCMAFLGRAAEGEVLFKRAVRLNPYRNLWYYQYGSFIYFVQGKFEESIKMALKRQLTNIWVDLPGYIAASYANLGQKDEAARYLSMFIDIFTKTICRGERSSSKEVIDWVEKANPFKHREDTDRIVDGLILAGLSSMFSKSAHHPIQLPPPAAVNPSIFKHEDKIWYFAFEGAESTMTELKGFHDIQRLLSTPDQDVHCTELMGSESNMAKDDVILDSRARREYNNHIRDLRRDMAEAEEMNDLGRKNKLQSELEEILDHLSKELGLGKKSRKLNSPAEKARAAVTLRIRSAIKKIGSCHPPLAKHLSNSIRTGVFCSYSPEERRKWFTD